MLGSSLNSIPSLLQASCWDTKYNLLTNQICDYFLITQFLKLVCCSSTRNNLVMKLVLNNRFRINFSALTCKCISHKKWCLASLFDTMFRSIWSGIVQGKLVIWRSLICFQIALDDLSREPRRSQSELSSPVSPTTPPSATSSNAGSEHKPAAKTTSINHSGSSSSGISGTVV